MDAFQDGKARGIPDKKWFIISILVEAHLTRVLLLTRNIQRHYKVRS